MLYVISDVILFFEINIWFLYLFIDRVINVIINLLIISIDFINEILMVKFNI